MKDGHNIKDRLLYCPRCKEDSRNNDPAPICPRCKGRLITVTFSTLDGHRITGIDPLVIPLWQEVKK